MTDAAACFNRTSISYRDLDIKGVDMRCHATYRLSPEGMLYVTVTGVMRGGASAAMSHTGSAASCWTTLTRLLSRNPEG